MFRADMFSMSRKFCCIKRSNYFWLLSICLFICLLSCLLFCADYGSREAIFGNGLSLSFNLPVQAFLI